MADHVTTPTFTVKSDAFGIWLVLRDGKPFATVYSKDDAEMFIGLATVRPRLAVAEQLLRDAVREFEAHGDEENADEIRAFLAGGAA